MNRVLLGGLASLRDISCSQTMKAAKISQYVPKITPWLLLQTSIFASMNIFCRTTFFLLFSFFLSQVYAQSPGTVKGKVIDPNNRPIQGVKVSVNEEAPRYTTGEDGLYEIKLSPGRYLIKFSHPTHEAAQLDMNIVSGYVYTEPVKMLELTLDESLITEKKQDPPQVQIFPIKAEEILKMPTFNRSVEAAVKFLPGVASNNEFSSQYQVRGGNFDENLVYVNGIEIYRPFLSRNGQQEGLGFSNPDMAQDIKFSTGGFAAQYGDRLSSVLDITYRTPEKFRGTVEAGFLTQSVHAEGTSANKINPDKPGRFTYLLGARRFSTTYLLNSLETRGEYRPEFVDVQSMFTFTPKTGSKETKYKTRGNDTTRVVYYPQDRLKLTGFLALTRNRYLFEPDGRETTFGTIQQAFRLRTGFEGRETSNYTTGLGALMLTHQPTTNLQFNYTFTAFRTSENELFDVEGGYLLGEVNTSFGSDEFNESEFDLGIGSEYRHARNYLTADVISGQFNGYWFPGNTSKHKLLFGLKYQYQEIDDELKEYTVLDSAGYAVDPFGRFGVNEFIEGEANLVSRLYKAYIQHEFQLGRATQLITGVRAVYYDLIDDLMISPRVQFVYDASKLPAGKELRLRLATGVYYQPPFYREFRRLDGTLNLNLEPQRSIHFIAGLDYTFKAWGRPFKLISEAYYKDLSNLIPYEVQNVRLRYYPDRLATGYAYGLDARISGQFIKGADSWISVGYLKTAEDIVDDEQGEVPRPMDQRITFAMYFQDELPSNPTFKVHMSYLFGSGFRHGPPTVFESRTAFDFPAYHRVDIGFSKLISFVPKTSNVGKRGVESIWATLEIFNLFQRENTVSYVWIKDLNNNRFAVPNRLSARLLNFRVVAKFR